MRRDDGFSQQIVSFVDRSLESVVVDNVSESETFSDLDSIHSDALSIVCFPLLSQDVLIGIAYLENRRTRYAFLPSHLGVLKIVASQAAISIEKSKLYKALTLSEEKYRGIIENADIGVFQATCAFIYFCRFIHDRKSALRGRQS